MPPYCTPKPEGILIDVFVQPRSAKNMVVGPHGDALKVKLTAPPVEGAANKMCVAFFAKTLKSPKSAVEILSGHASRSKTVLIRVPDDTGNRAERKRIMDFLASFSQKTS